MLQGHPVAVSAGRKIPIGAAAPAVGRLGEVDIGESSTLDFVITNAGAGALSGTVSCPDGKVVTSQVTIPIHDAGGKATAVCLLPIAFLPLPANCTATVVMAKEGGS